MRSVFISAVCASILVFSTTAFAENGANDYLLSITPKQQAIMLGKVVGDGCRGTKAFYMGSMDDKKHQEDSLKPLSGAEHDAFWSVKCTNNKSYMVEVHPAGDGKVLECEMIELLNAGHCFKKF